MHDRTANRFGTFALGLCVGVLSLGLGACHAGTEPDPVAVPQASYADHEEASDFGEVPDDGKADGVPSSFDRNLILDESFFLDSTTVDADDIQLFLEQTPYDRTCFLATEWVGDVRAADAIASAAQAESVNPIVLLARLQVERSIISKSTRPSSHSVDYAFGCGCPDGQECNDAYQGLGAQMECAAETMMSLHELSVDATGEWAAGKAHKSLDGYTVKPKNHATAAMYGYTPWVLPGSGGNWLVWNVTRRFVKHFRVLGVIE